MEEKLEYLICNLPQEEDCNRFLEYMTIEEKAVKDSTIKNVLLENAKIIKESAFENCKELKFVAWGKEDALKKVPQIVFMMNENFITGFTAITVESKKENTLGKTSDISPIIIQKAAFKGCEKLETVIFPKNKCIIEKDVFAQCKSLRTIVFPGVETEIIDDPFIGCKDLTIVCNKDDYKLQAYARAHSFRIIELN